LAISPAYKVDHIINETAITLKTNKGEFDI